jgi:hypothetical protein
MNLITCLEDHDGTSFFNHHQKANMIWEAFKERLGISEFNSIHFNLDSVLQTSSDLNSLVEPFSTMEMDLVVRNLPSDKSPGPDGFNIDFVKKC